MYIGRLETTFARSIYLFSLVLFHMIYADNPLFQEPGVGTRSLGLADNFIGVADDFSATYWNPGGLAFTPVREIQVSLEELKNSMQSTFSMQQASMDNQRFRFANIGWLRSIPTTQGGFSFAMGYSNPFLFDNIYTFSGNDVYLGDGTNPYISPYFKVNPVNKKDTIFDTLKYGDTLNYDQAESSAYGQIGMFNIAAGWQIAENIGFGLSFGIYNGEENQKQEFKTHHIKGGKSILFENFDADISRKYSGIDIRAGFLVKPLPWLSAGVSIATPPYIWFDQEYHMSDRTFNEGYTTNNSGKIEAGFHGGIGASVKLPFILATSQLDGRAPVSGASKGSSRSSWQGGVGVGVEVPIPYLPIILRGGYRFQSVDLYQYGIRWNGGFSSVEPTVTHEREMNMITGGISFVVGNSLTLDGAYSFTDREYSITDPDWQNITKEHHIMQRFQGSVSYHY